MNYMLHLNSEKINQANCSHNDYLNTHGSEMRVKTLSIWNVSRDGEGFIWELDTYINGYVART